MWSNYVLNICVYTHKLVLYAILARGAFLHSEQQLKQTKLIEVLRMGVECLVLNEAFISPPLPPQVWGYHRRRVDRVRGDSRVLWNTAFTRHDGHGAQESTPGQANRNNQHSNSTNWTQWTWDGGAVVMKAGKGVRESPGTVDKR